MSNRLHVLTAESAHYAAPATRHEVARGTYEEMKAAKRERRDADEARGHYSTLYTINPAEEKTT